MGLAFEPVCGPPEEGITLPPWLEAGPPVVIPTWEISVKVATYAIAMICGIVGNTLIIIVIGLNKKLHTATNLYLANLAVSDLVTSSFSMWVHLGSQITSDWLLGEGICKVTSFVQAMCATSSVFFMVVIALDRFFAIVFPLRRHNRHSMMKSHWVIPAVVIATWMAAAATAAPQCFYWKLVTLKWSDRTEIFCDEDWPKVYYQTADGLCLTKQPTRDLYITIHIVLLYFSPLVILVITYTAIVVSLRKTRGTGSSVNGAHQQHHKYQKVVRMLIILLLAFVVCWTPFQAIVLYDTHRPRNQQNVSYIKDLKYAFTFLAYSNSSLNPILYGALNNNFRRGLVDLFKDGLCKRRVHPDNTTNGRWALTVNSFGRTTALSRNPIRAISESNGNRLISMHD